MKLLSLFSFLRITGNKIFFILGILLLTVTLTSCKSLDTKFKSEQDVILYAGRFESMTSGSDKAHFYLNGTKIAEINGDSYIAMHLKPGKYSARWKVYSSKGEPLADLDYGFAFFKAGVAYGTAVNAVWGWHPPFDKFEEDIQGKTSPAPNLQEEIDLRNIIKPLK